MASNGRQKVLDAIIGYITEHQYPPTIREICDMTGLKSPSTVQLHITNLMKDGLLETDHEYGASRALRVTGYKFIKCDLVKDALEKQIPKKPIFQFNLSDTNSRFVCQCGNIIKVHHDIGIMDNNDAPKFCDNCGQKLDWESDEE